MVRRFLAIVAWLALGHAVLAALFWGLLQVPESTVFMVALSALLVILMLAVAAWTEVLALLTWDRTTVVAPPAAATTAAGAVQTAEKHRGGGVGSRARTAVAAVPAFLIALVLFGVVFAATGRAGAWLTTHRGEIDAWMIVHLKLVKTTVFHGALAWLLWFVRYGIGLSLSLALLLYLATSGLRSISQLRWLTHGLRPGRVILVAAWMFVFVWLPWHGVYWRPKRLPATWLEPAFVMAKLGLIYVLANVGWALALKTVSARRARDSRR